MDLNIVEKSKSTDEPASVSSFIFYCNPVSKDRGVLIGVVLVGASLFLYFAFFNRLGWPGGPLSLMVAGAVFLELQNSCRMRLESSELYLTWLFRKKRVLQYDSLVIRVQDEGVTLVPTEGAVFWVQPQWWSPTKRARLAVFESALRSRMDASKVDVVGQEDP